jgi:hypothetical protein
VEKAGDDDFVTAFVYKFNADLPDTLKVRIPPVVRSNGKPAGDASHAISGKSIALSGDGSLEYGFDRSTWRRERKDSGVYAWSNVE